jgi:2-polyprenyl-6-hydroxyphenyl methylase/3-demethylubiquinone-9 3-methyltransferase
MAVSLTFAADRGKVPCTVCAAPSPLMGVVDFHKSCLEREGRYLPPLGLPVYYRRCPECGLVFADTMLAWGDEDFSRHIYNADYPLVDPDYAEIRPRANAQWLREWLGKAGRGLRLVDFGGGSGRLAAELRRAGLRAATVDPHVDHPVPDFGPADLVTAFEVFEHAARPGEALDRMLELMAEGGALILSTLLQPADFDAVGLSWWYVAPRNGHVTIHSRTSLERLLASRGLRLFSLSEGMHLAFRDPPAFLRHRIGGNS